MNKPNTTLIGLFVVAAVGLAIAATVALGSNRFFDSPQTYVVYFDASMTGLNVGAPVKFRGVTIGSVKEVLIRFNQKSGDHAMPVLIEIDEKLLQKKTDGE